jgi:hypothetical protein
MCEKRELRVKTSRSPPKIAVDDAPDRPSHALLTLLATGIDRTNRVAQIVA